MNDKASRRNSPPIKVYCLPSERQEIEDNAKRAGLPASSFLLRVGMGWQLTGVVDAEQVDNLLKINADLGRLGGLLKLWLTDDARTREFSPALIRAVLSKIEATQEEMTGTIHRVVRPRAERNQGTIGTARHHD